jgi:hypothetical protein
VRVLFYVLNIAHIYLAKCFGKLASGFLLFSERLRANLLGIMFQGIHWYYQERRHYHFNDGTG